MIEIQGLEIRRPADSAGHSRNCDMSLKKRQTRPQSIPLVLNRYKVDFSDHESSGKSTNPVRNRQKNPVR
jgi:hypothetical protein